MQKQTQYIIHFCQVIPSCNNVALSDLSLVCVYEKGILLHINNVVSR